MDQSWFLYCLRLWCSYWLKFLSMCWRLFFLFSCFLPSSFRVPRHSWCFLTWHLNAVHALCLYFFPLKTLLWIQLWGLLKCSSFFFLFYFCTIAFCPFYRLTPHVLSVVSHAHIEVCCGFQRGKKKKNTTFTGSVWDHSKTYFFSNAFWTIVLKKMSILIFTCYMTCTYL